MQDKDNQQHQCNIYNNQPKQCIENNCWYYFQQKKCGVNYINKKNTNKQISIIEKRSNKRKLSRKLLKKLSRKLLKKLSKKLSKKSKKK